MMFYIYEHDIFVVVIKWAIIGDIRYFPKSVSPDFTVLYGSMLWRSLEVDILKLTLI